jgi:hypothetical protein
MTAMRVFLHLLMVSLLQSLFLLLASVAGVIPYCYDLAQGFQQVKSRLYA